MSIECFTSEPRSIPFREEGPNTRDHAVYRLPLADFGPQKPKGNSFFSKVSETAIRAMDEMRHIASYCKDTVVFLEGDTAHGIYILYEGRANVLTANREGKTLVLKTALPGDILGLNSVLAGTPHGVTVETVEPCRFAFIAREDLLKFLGEHGDACLYFAQYLSRDCHSAYDLIRSAGNPVPKRLARFLIDCCANGHMSDGIVRATVALTHGAIAQRIGCSRETVSRALSDLKRRRIAELVGIALRVHDRAALESLAAS
jgi:CRP/FNR family transcriptional regulator, cyclic AMP receptor protein